MYSAVLMLALTAGTETADFGRRGCSGCSGCTGVVVGCSGKVAAAMSPKVAMAAMVAGLFAWMRERHSCHGCTGSCGGVVVSTGCCGGTVAAPPVQMKPMPKPEPVAPPKKCRPRPLLMRLSSSAFPASACRLIVQIRAPTSSTSEQRSLNTHQPRSSARPACLLHARRSRSRWRHHGPDAASERPRRPNRHGPVQ